MSSLYGTLSNLPGLNLYTSDGGITLDFNYKHIFKREHLPIYESMSIVIDIAFCRL